MFPSVTTHILHPDLFRPNGPAEHMLHEHTILSSKWMTEYRPTLNHSATRALVTDVETLTHHAQTLLATYAHSGTADLELLVIPTIQNSFTRLFDGAYAQWDPKMNRVNLEWATTDLTPAIKILTHEIGHHLRSDIAGGLPITEFLLHEAAAEALVLDAHGMDSLHYHRSSIADVRAHLRTLLEKERDGQAFTNQDHNRLANWHKNDALYPPATNFMLRLGLTPAQLFVVPVREFLDMVLPLCDDLS